MEIAILSPGLSSDELLQTLRAHAGHGASDIDLVQRKRKSAARAIETVIVVALIKAAGPAVVALIHAALAVAMEKKRRKIILRGTDGDKPFELEIPVGTSRAEIGKAVKAWERVSGHSLLVPEAEPQV